MRLAVLRRLGALIAALGLVLPQAVTPVLAASITVNSLADTAADDGVCTLREAIIAANTESASGVSAGECAAGLGDDTITFVVAGTITLASALPTITSGLWIIGDSAITVSGAGSYRVFDLSLAVLTLSGLTITGGAASGDGGAINSSAGVLTVTNSTISGNAATLSGGGINSVNGFPTIISNSTISGNSAGRDGGGIRIDGNLTVTNSTISGNSAALGGGGIHVSPGLRGRQFTITNSTISGNSATSGGGVINTGTIFNGRDGELTVTNSTISGNSATSGGGGFSAGGTDALMNSIVAGNTAPSGPEVDGGVEVVTSSLVGVPVGKTLSDVLVPAGLADNGGPTKTIALALVAGNPAIDTATGSICAAAPVNALDQRGMPRPPACDIGAYEAQPPVLAAHANVSVAATSAEGAVVVYTAPAATDEQGGVAAVSCIPASGSTFAPGATTVSCTATDAVGHTATGTFQVFVSAVVPPSTLPDTATPNRSNGTSGIAHITVLLALLGLATHRRVNGRWAAKRRVLRRRSAQVGCVARGDRARYAARSVRTAVLEWRSPSRRGTATAATGRRPRSAGAWRG